jgi:hypothetical protein
MGLPALAGLPLNQSSDDYRFVEADLSHPRATIARGSVLEFNELLEAVTLDVLCNQLLELLDVFLLFRLHFRPECLQLFLPLCI